MSDEFAIPTPALVVLIGPSGCGKTTWAEKHFREGQILSSDHFRSYFGTGPHDQTVSTEAFGLLNSLLDHRLDAGLTTVVDTLGLDAEERQRYRQRAADAGMACVAVGFDTDPAICHERNAARDRSVPKSVLDKQIRRWRQARDGLDDEGFDQVIIDPGPPRLVPDAMVVEAQAQAPPPGAFAFDLVVSSFDFGDDLEGTLVAIAQAAERAGFRALWVMDHFRQIPQVGRAWDPMLEGYTTLAYLAAKTSTLRLGTLVTGIEHRNVGLLAKIIATLDVLSGGRAECGIGGGWFSAEQAAYGYPVNSNKVRLDTLEDALQALPLLWGPGSKSFEGKVISIPEALAYPRPLQDPLPILVGGGGEKRTLRMVAQHAQASNLMGDLATIQHKIDVLQRHCAEVGRDPDEIAITVLSPLVHARSGADLQELVERLRPQNQSAEAFAAANAAGTTAEHVEHFRRLADLGVDRACVVLAGNDGPERVEAFGEVIEAFA